MNEIEKVKSFLKSKGYSYNSDIVQSPWKPKSTYTIVCELLIEYAQFQQREVKDNYNKLLEAIGVLLKDKATETELNQLIKLIDTHLTQK